MPSLKDLKIRIASIKATQKITKAMQMVAAAKLRRAQSAAEAARPYSKRMAKVLNNIASGVSGNNGPRLLVGTGSDQRHLLIIATSERGLCGGFNGSIVRLARARLRELVAEGKEVKILCVGKKGYESLKHAYSSYLLEPITFRDVKNIGYVNAQQVGERVLDMFNKNSFDVCTLFFSQFQSVISQVPTAQQLIPAEVDKSHDAAPAGIYEYEPSDEEILHDLLPRNVNVQIFHALLENGASEQGARMTAMDNATRNAGEIINKLTLHYNRQRQAQITKELIEIISGAEAL